MYISEFDNLSAEELQLRSGADSKAKDELVKRYLPLVKSRVLFYYGTGSEYDDFIQEAYLGFLSAIDSFDGTLGVPFGSFAKLCVDRAIGNFSASRQHLETSSHISLDERLSTPAVGPEDLAISRDGYDAVIRKARKELSAFEYDVMCHYVCGYKLSEIADSMSVPNKSVDNAIQRIRAKLKR